MKINNKNFFGRLFCKHEYQLFHKPVKKGEFLNLRGETYIKVCPKCGSNAGEEFHEDRTW